MSKWDFRKNNISQIIILENKQFGKGDVIVEIFDLTVFLAVVRTGGVIRASEGLHRAQSSVTSRIQALEEKLSV